MCSIGRDARVVSMKFLWKVGLPKWIHGRWRVVDFFLVCCRYNNMANIFFWSPSSALNFATGNMTPWFFLVKSISRNCSCLANRQDLRSRSLRMKLMSPCGVNQIPTIRAIFLESQICRFPHFVTPSFRLLWWIWRGGGCSAASTSDFFGAGLVILVYEAQEFWSLANTLVVIFNLVLTYLHFRAIATPKWHLFISSWRMWHVDSTTPRPPVFSSFVKSPGFKHTSRNMRQQRCWVLCRIRRRPWGDTFLFDSDRSLGVHAFFFKRNIHTTL